MRATILAGRIGPMKMLILMRFHVLHPRNLRLIKRRFACNDEGIEEKRWKIALRSSKMKIRERGRVIIKIKIIGSLD